MKKYLSILAVLMFVFVFSTSTTNAQTSSSGTKTGAPKIKTELKQDRQTLIAEMQQKRAEMKNKVEALRTEAKTKFQALKDSLKNEKDATQLKLKELRISSRENALGRLDNAVTRLTTMEDRVNGLISKLGAKSLDTTSATGFVAVADTKLTDAKSKIVTINTLLSKSITEITPADKATLKTLFQDTQTLLKDAHSALKNAVKSLKDQLPKTQDGNENTGNTDTNSTSGTNTNNQ